MTTLEAKPTLRKVARGEVRLPLKVVMGANSQGAMVVPARTRRTDGTYSEQLERILTDDVRLPASVISECQWFGTIAELRRRYEPAIRNHWPDVVVLQFGAVECQPNVIPTWLSRNFMGWDRSSHPAAVWYHARIAPPLFKRLRRVQRYAAAKDWPTYRLSPARFERELRHLIEVIRKETGALVLVLDLDQFGDRIRYWLPNSDRRRATYMDIMQRVTDSYDDNVRLVQHALPCDEEVLNALLPDGLHRSADGHRLTAEAITREILTWLDQP